MSDDIQIWQSELDGPASAIARFESWLSPDERARADRFRFEHDRRRFIVRRGVLRAILGMRLDIEPRVVQFAYGAHGKPRLAELSVEVSVRFNASHAHELALVAVGLDREVGIDVEYVRPVLEAARIAETLFSPNEWEALSRLPESDRLDGFFTCWTLKEAYVKARGEGLSMPLNTFDVPLQPGQVAWLPNGAGEASEPGGWWLRAFTPRPGYRAALAWQGPVCEPRLCSWNWF